MMKVTGLIFCEWHPEAHHFTYSGQCWVWFCWSWQNSYVQSVVKFYWQLQAYILFKAAGALAVCFLGCFKYCLSWIAFKGNALCVWTVSFLLFSLSCVFPLISLLITLCNSLQENLARFLLLCRDGRHALCSPWWPCQVTFSHFPLLPWSPFQG